VTTVANEPSQRAISMDEPWQEAIRESDFSAEASVRGHQMEVTLSGTADFMMKGTSIASCAPCTPRPNGARSPR